MIVAPFYSPVAWTIILQFFIFGAVTELRIITIFYMCIWLAARTQIMVGLRSN